MSTEARVYVVRTPKGTRLVRAISQTAALRHVTTPDYHAEAASVDEVVHHMGAGVKVEDAKAELRVAGTAS
jgi:hypothetical protein